MNLFPKRDARVGAEEHQRRARLAVLAGDDVLETIAASGRRGIEQALNVDLRSSFESELPVVSEGRIIQMLADLRRQFGQDAHVVARVVERRGGAPPDLPEGVGGGGGNLGGVSTV